MIPTYQTILHDPANGQHGNCMSAVIASLLHLPIESVPVFTNPNTWQAEVNRFLRPFGLAYIEVQGFTKWCEDFDIRGCYHEAAGPSPRMPDVFHACVGVDGKVVFDPHPGAEGLDDVQTGGLFIALKPWVMASKAMPPEPALSTEEDEDFRQTVIGALMASKSWTRAYAESSVDEWLDRRPAAPSLVPCSEQDADLIHAEYKRQAHLYLNDRRTNGAWFMAGAMFWRSTNGLTVGREGG